MSFKDLWVLLFIPIIIIWIYSVRRRQVSSGFYFSSTSLLSGLGTSARAFFSSKLIYLRCITLILMFLALARPQSPVKDTIRRTEGIDIVMAIDASTSMLAEDFNDGKERYNRLDAVKKVLPNFVDARINDRLGAVIFATRAYTLSPLTLNHEWFLKNIERIEAGKLGNQTAIGSAITSSLSRLKKSESKSKVIILLTDGRNNAGQISPMTATELAGALNVKIYTIGAGSFGSVPYPIKSAQGEIIGYENIKIDMDEGLLKEIASGTGGKYFRVTDIDSLKKVYREIDKLEKVQIQESAYEEYNELFGYFLVAAFILLLLEIILSNTILRRLP
ncbi:MAG: VWA domain-containing protein [Candidatus Omnitrophica bacterium]|nr:VWA domain-containing protein [Candidatus Omnitrophota bacterium]